MFESVPAPASDNNPKYVKSQRAQNRNLKSLLGHSHSHHTVLNRETIDKESNTKYVKPVSKSSPTIVSKLETLKISQKKSFIYNNNNNNTTSFLYDILKKQLLSSSFKNNICQKSNKYICHFKTNIFVIRKQIYLPFSVQTSNIFVSSGTGQRVLLYLYIISDDI